MLVKELLISFKTSNVVNLIALLSINVFYNIASRMSLVSGPQYQILLQ